MYETLHKKITYFCFSATYGNSSFDVVISNYLGTFENEHTTDIFGHFLKLMKPSGKLVVRNNKTQDDFKSNLLLSGFVNSEQGTDGIYYASKPNYEVGSGAKLSFGPKSKATVAKVWKLDDTEEDDLINPDDLLDEDDKVMPDPSSLRVCGTTGKRKACKDCSCGLAEELAGEAVPANPIQKSSCGSVSLFANILCNSFFFTQVFYLVLFGRRLQMCNLSVFGDASL